MTLSEIARMQYLDAMGITVWQSRSIPTFIAPKQHKQPQIGSQNTTLDSWKQLRHDVMQCELCTLCTTRTQTVFGEGNLKADWLFIGEAPGQNEDEQGRPFVGEAGQLLTEMLRAISLTREDVFIANILKCRPPNNRDPHIDEVLACRRYLHQQMMLIQPKIIVALGRIAAQTLLDTHETIGKLRSKVHLIENTPLIAMYHPSYLLRSPLEKRKAWEDLQFALQTVKNIF